MSNDESTWYAGIIGHHMNDGRVIAVAPVTNNQDAVVILVDKYAAGEYAIAKLYQHQFERGSLPQEWDQAQYKPYYLTSKRSILALAIMAMAARAAGIG